MQQCPLDLGEQQDEEGRRGDELREVHEQETRRTRIERTLGLGEASNNDITAFSR